MDIEQLKLVHFTSEHFENVDLLLIPSTVMNEVFHLFILNIDFYTLQQKKNIF